MIGGPTACENKLITVGDEGVSFWSLSLYFYKMIVQKFRDICASDQAGLSRRTLMFDDGYGT